MHKYKKKAERKGSNNSIIKSIESNLNIIENDIREKDKKIFSLKRDIEDMKVTQLKTVENLFKILENLNSIRIYCEEKDNSHVIESINRSIKDIKIELKEANNKINLENKEPVLKKNNADDKLVLDGMCSKKSNRKKSRKIKKTIKVIPILVIIVIFTCISLSNIQRARNLELTLIKKNGLYGYQDQNKNIIIDTKYERAGEFNKENIAIVKEINGNWIIINKSGQKASPHEFDEIKDFKEGLALVKLDGLYGYIDENGKIKIKPQYMEAYDFCEGRAKVRLSKSTLFKFIDRDGNNKNCTEKEGLD